MITSKRQILKVMKETAAPHKLNREQKFQVFINVCDNLLDEGRMTKATHKRFTHMW